MNLGVGQLRGHHPPQREQGFLETDQKQRQPQQDVDKPHKHPPRMRQGTADHQELEDHYHHHDGQQVAQRVEKSLQQVVPPRHWITMPYIMTKIMGVSEANAIRPKPSTMGLRPEIEDASPTPRAATSGTVMVEVVTPPES